MIPAITYSTSWVAPAKSARMNAGIAAGLPLPPCSWAILRRLGRGRRAGQALGGRARR